MKEVKCRDIPITVDREGEGTATLIQAATTPFGDVTKAWRVEYKRHRAARPVDRGGPTSCSLNHS